MINNLNYVLFNVFIDKIKSNEIKISKLKKLHN